jgi:hypothetical protein
VGQALWLLCVSGPFWVRSQVARGYSCCSACMCALTSMSGAVYIRGLLLSHVQLLFLLGSFLANNVLRSLLICPLHLITPGLSVTCLGMFNTRHLCVYGFIRHSCLTVHCEAAVPYCLVDVLTLVLSSISIVSLSIFPLFTSLLILSFLLVFFR